MKELQRQSNVHDTLCKKMSCLLSASLFPELQLVCRRSREGICYVSKLLYEYVSDDFIALPDSGDKIFLSSDIYLEPLMW